MQFAIAFVHIDTVAYFDPISPSNKIDIASQIGGLDHLFPANLFPFGFVHIGLIFLVKGAATINKNLLVPMGLFYRCGHATF